MLPAKSGAAAKCLRTCFKWLCFYLELWVGWNKASSSQAPAIAWRGYHNETKWWSCGRQWSRPHWREPWFQIWNSQPFLMFVLERFHSCSACIVPLAKSMGANSNLDLRGDTNCFNFSLFMQLLLFCAMGHSNVAAKGIAGRQALQPEVAVVLNLCTAWCAVAASQSRIAWGKPRRKSFCQHKE